MKKFFGFLMAAAVLFGAASCAKEDISSSIANGEQVEVTFTANLTSLGTRAEFGDGAQVNTLRYFVFDAEGNFLSDELNGVKSISVNGPATVNLPLIKGMTYNILFWADFIENNIEYYSIDETTGVVSINSEVGINANDEKRDAFYSIVTNFNPATATSEDTKVELRRPFAQLNAISNAEDLAALGNSHVVLSTSAISAEVYTTLDPFASENEQLSNKRLVEFAAANNPDTANGHLSMNYIFAPVNGCLADVTFTFNNSNDGVQSTTTTYTNIPLQRNYKTNIIGKLLTKSTDFTVEIKPGFNDSEYEVVAVNNAAELQDALDNAVAGTTIELQPGVNYGTVYLRPVAGSPATKVVDWQGNNYRWETYSCFEDLTIVGAQGATIDAIVVEGGTYYNTAHSQAATYPVMLSLVELKNVVLDGVTFTGKGGYDPQGYGNAINLSGNNIKVNGLTLKNCVLNNSENNARLLYKTESTTHVHTYTYNGETFTFSPSMKDITVTGCTLNGGYMGLELRETENVTITNNVFEVGDRNILLAVNSGCTYTGQITITGNTSKNAKERFVRADGTGDAVVVIKDNIIENYLGADADYIKVTNGTNVTIENNTFAQSATVIVPENNTADVVVSANDATNVTVPANEAEAGANYKVVISDENRTTDSTGKTTVDFDLTLYKNGEEVSGDVIYTIAKNIGADLFITEVTHNGNALTEATTGADQTYTYNSTEGVLTIYTKSFSPFAVTYIESKDYVKKLNKAHNKNSTISVSTGDDFLPIAAVNPEIYGYSVYDGDTRIANAVTFRFSKVKKETINENSYKVSLNLAVLDENGNELEIKDGRMNQYITSDPREHLHVFMNLIEVPAGYAISQVKVGGTELTLTQDTRGNCATGEYWVGSDPDDLYFQSRTAGLIEVTVAKAN